MSHLFSKFGYNHQEHIHGLYRDSKNTVDVSFVNKEGKVLLTETIEVETTTPEDLVPDFFSARQTVISKPDKMEPGVTIVNDQGGGNMMPIVPICWTATGRYVGTFGYVIIRN